jgi:actin related protein 2/3 complex subunit 1A/1B
MSDVIFGKNQFGKSAVTVHVWNATRTQLAVSIEFGKVNVYGVEAGVVTLQATLGEHTGKVTGIDWCPKSNQIATCSSDRNAFVWVYRDGEWKPTLVLLRVNRACTCIHWSPNGDKFAVGTGSRVIAVCYLDVGNNFWVSKHVKKPIRSTITCLDWHPNNMLLVAGGTDFKMRVFSVFISDVEKKPESGSVWGPMKPFGAMLAEFDTDGWVHDVAFDNAGERAVGVSHGSAVTMCSPSGGAVKLSWDKLPFQCVTWISDARILCAGYDFTPEVFNVAPDGTLQHAGSLDKLTSGEAKTGSKAMQRFLDIDKKGQPGSDISDVTLKSVHKNTVMSVLVMAGDKSGAAKVSTSSLDGQVVVWDVASLEASLEALRI